MFVNKNISRDAGKCAVIRILTNAKGDVLGVREGNGDIHYTPRGLRVIARPSASVQLHGR